MTRYSKLEQKQASAPKTVPATTYCHLKANAQGSETTSNLHVTISFPFQNFSISSYCYPTPPKKIQIGDQQPSLISKCQPPKCSPHYLQLFSHLVNQPMQLESLLLAIIYTPLSVLQLLHISTFKSLTSTKTVISSVKYF